MSCILRALAWGRNTHDSVHKFLVFQLTCNGMVLTVAALCALTSGRMPLNVMQLLWTNLVMDSLGALGTMGGMVWELVSWGMWECLLWECGMV